MPSNVRWESGAAEVAQVNTYAFGGVWEADDLIRVTAGHKIKDITAGSTITATVTATVDTGIDALSSTTYPEVTSPTSGVTATSSGTTTLTLTANAPGVPFTISLTPLEANGSAADAQTIEGAGVATTGTVATANAGPHVYGTAANWSTAAKPIAGDSLFIDNSDRDILYDLNQAGATLAAGYIAMSFTGTIGLPKINQLGVEYPEYLPDYLKLDCSVWHIGLGPGSGSGRIKIDSGTVQSALTIHNTGSPLESGLEAFLWKGTNVNNSMSVRGNSSVGVAVFGGESATLLTLIVEENATVRCGISVTLGTITVNGGELTINSNVGTKLDVYDGIVNINGTATVAQLNVYGGTVFYNSTGTLGGNTFVGERGLIDFSQGVGAVAVTNPIDAYNTNPVNDPDKRVTSLVIDYNGQAPVPGLGTNVRLTRALPA